MDKFLDERQVLRFKNFSGIMGILTFAMGFIVMLGWIFDVPLLKSVLPGLVTMKANTAVCFILAGLALWILQTKHTNRAARGIGRTCCLICAAIGALTVYEYTSGVDLGIDQLFIKEDVGAVLTGSPGRMAANTAAAFVLAGLALFLLDMKTRGAHVFGQLFAFLGWMIAVLALLGYLYGVKSLYGGITGFTAMALHTALAFFMVFIGAFFIHSETGFAAIFSSRGTGGKIARVLVPATLIIPPCLGLLKLWGERTSVIPNELGVSFVAVANMFVISGSVLWLAAALRRTDGERQRVAEELKNSESKHRVLFESSQDAIMVLAPPSWAFVEGNPAALKMFEAKTKAEFLAVRPWQVSPEKQPDGRASEEKAKEMIETAMREGSNYFKWEHKRLTGEIFPATVLLTRMQWGGQTLLQATVRDITEQKRLEELLLESEKKFMDVLYASKDAILLIDGEKFVDCNDATTRMLGYPTREKLLMTHPSELSPPEQPDGRKSFEKANEMMKLAFEQGFNRFEWIHEKASGEDFPVEVSLTPISIHGKNMLHCLWSDLTEIKKAESEAEKKTRELEVFYKASMGREEKILGLKEKVRKLEQELKGK